MFCFFNHTSGLYEGVYGCLIIGGCSSGIGDSKNDENAKLWGKWDRVGINVLFF